MLSYYCSIKYISYHHTGCYTPADYRGWVPTTHIVLFHVTWVYYCGLTATYGLLHTVTLDHGWLPGLLRYTRLPHAWLVLTVPVTVAFTLHPQSLVGCRTVHTRSRTFATHTQVGYLPDTGYAWCSLHFAVWFHGHTWSLVGFPVTRLPLQFTVATHTGGYSTFGLHTVVLVPTQLPVPVVTPNTLGGHFTVSPPVVCWFPRS